MGLLSICSIIATESEQQSKKQLDKYGDVASAYQNKTPLLLPVPKRKTEVTMQAVPTAKDAAKQAPEAATAEASIKAAKIEAKVEGKVEGKHADDAQAVAAELVQGVMHRVLTSLEASASSEEGSAAEQPTAAKPKSAPKKKGGAKKGGKRK